MPLSPAPGVPVLEESPRCDGLELRIAGLLSDNRLAEAHTAWGKNLSPPLQWTPEPQALSYAVVVQAIGSPFLHWAIWNIPGVANGLDGAIPAQARPHAPGEVVQGVNGAGGHGWHGPSGETRDLRVQMFALDRRLDLAPETPLLELLAVLHRTALSGGEITLFCDLPARQ